MSLDRPALDPSTLPPWTSSTYPEIFRSRVLPREKRALGDTLGLTQYWITHPDDTAAYPDEDLVCSKNAEGKWIYAHRNGEPY